MAGKTANVTPVEIVETVETVETAKKKDTGCVNLDVMCPVFLPTDDNKPETDQYEIVSVNGKTYQIARGVPVEVPYKVFEALYNSGRFKRL